MHANSKAAKVFWAIVQKPGMGASIKTADEVEVFAATDLAELMSPATAAMIAAAVAQWRDYDGHRLTEFLLYLIDSLNEVGE